MKSIALERKKVFFLNIFIDLIKFKQNFYILEIASHAMSHGMHENETVCYHSNNSNIAFYY